MSRPRVIVLGNSHIDPVWLWDKYEGIDETINTFRSACDRLDEYPDLRFAASSACLYRWVEEQAPEVLARIQAHVASGRWEIAGAWWVEADTNLPLRESFLHSARISRSYFRERFGVTPLAAYSPDTFGHPAPLPSILAETGFRYYVFSRPGAHEKPDLPSDIFWWRHGNDRVLCWRLRHHYTQPMGRLAEALQDPSFLRHGLALFLFGVGDHGGGPTRQEIEDIQRIAKGSAQVDVRFGTLSEFFAAAETLEDIPEVEGDLHYHAVGCYSVNRMLKTCVREAERALSFAERVDPAACLDPLWQTTLFNEFHDILPGSCAPAAARKAQRELGGVVAEAEDLAYGALKTKSREIPVGHPQGEFRIYNSLPYPVTVPLEIESFAYYPEGAAFVDHRGNPIAVQLVPPSVVCANQRWLFADTLPAQDCGRYSFMGGRGAAPRLAPFAKGERVSCGAFTAASPGLVLGEGDPVFREPLALAALPDLSDTWSHGIEGYGEAATRFGLQSSTVCEGPLCSFLALGFAHGKSTAAMTFRLYRDLPYFDVDLMVMWEELQHVLKLEIVPPEPFHTWVVQGAGAPIVKTTVVREEPLHGWVHAGGVAFAQDGAFACDRVHDRLRVTLVRSTWYGYHDPYQLDPCAPHEPTDVGLHRFRFRFLVPTSTDAGVLDRACAAFVEPYQVLRESG